VVQDWVCCWAYAFDRAILELAGSNYVEDNFNVNGSPGEPCFDGTAGVSANSTTSTWTMLIAGFFLDWASLLIAGPERALLLSQQHKQAINRIRRGRQAVFPFAFRIKRLAGRVAVHESLRGPERRWLRDSITSGIGVKAEVWDLRSKRR
jgi:hypothetical protein